MNLKGVKETHRSETPSPRIKAPTEPHMVLHPISLHRRELIQQPKSLLSNTSATVARITRHFVGSHASPAATSTCRLGLDLSRAVAGVAVADVAIVTVAVTHAARGVFHFGAVAITSTTERVDFPGTATATAGSCKQASHQPHAPLCRTKRKEKSECWACDLPIVAVCNVGGADAFFGLGVVDGNDSDFSRV